MTKVSRPTNGVQARALERPRRDSEPKGLKRMCELLSRAEPSRMNSVGGFIKLYGEVRS